MTVYIPGSSVQALSVALQGLARPASLRGSNETLYMFGWETALNGSLWLRVETDYAINVHPEAELDGIADILQPFIDAGQLPADTNTTLTAFVETKRGQSLVVYEAFPPFFQGQAKELEQMIEDGLLAQPATP